MNVLILGAGNSEFEIPDGNYPISLVEIGDKPLIEHIVDKIKKLNPVKSTLCLLDRDVRRFHLDNVISILYPEATVLRVTDRTLGAACTALLASSSLNNDKELLILAANELIDTDFSVIIDDFRLRKLDAGTVTFPSIHPRYSYVRVDQNERVIEASEKSPISRYATAGFYWFAKGHDFVQGAKNMIKKDAHIDNLFYISPVFNELILSQKNVGIYEIDASCYHPLKSDFQVQKYISKVESSL